MTRFMLVKRNTGLARMLPAVFAIIGLLVPAAANAIIDGISGAVGAPVFNLTARAGNVSISDGGSVYSWGYSESSATTMQLPGPTLIVTQGDMVTVNLTNELPVAAGNVSIVFPGHTLDSTSGGVDGLLTKEAVSGGTVSYTFTATKPGTYQYHSGTRPDLQVEMGLYGALIVRPATVPVGCTGAAYAHPDTCFDREYLFLLSEMDIDVHQAVQLQAGGPGPIDVALEPYVPEYWLLNGRAGPDTMAAPFLGTLPTQPYNSLPRMHPGERLLLRVVGANHQMHPFHTHGNHSRVIARDGNLLLTSGGEIAGPLLFTIPSHPGGTVDSIFEWTGKDLGWDIYGTVADGMPAHVCNDTDGDGYNDNPTNIDPLAGPVTYHGEWCADHNKEIPVDLPDLSVLTFGGLWSGSPYLGNLGSLPPGEGGLNPSAGFTYMWHSHTERELVNNDVFPGGMMTFLIIEAPWVPIP